MKTARPCCGWMSRDGDSLKRLADDKCERAWSQGRRRLRIGRMSNSVARRANSRFWLPLRFRLRTLLTAMLVAAVFFAWFGWRLRKSQRQARAVAVLERVGTIWTYDYQDFDYELGRPRRTPARLGKPIGVIGKSAYSRRLH